ncbi:alpha/beta hydrolase [Acuticoccus sp. M5D2P5]|uniref:alpha/beta hydrolase n=1 Tax=Acuticoccus kalidii TaxID=2910977 RepID=UPI001F4711CB|nr:alpha/beta hydrolase [Acuticoccus kalidii]MCF3935809.1 alpha/beta hydrolase [Acuticoccus kalidii]
MLAVLIALFLGSGWLYAFNAERTHRHHNPFDADGVILKAEPQSLRRGSATLVVLLHGFGASPMTMAPIAERFAAETDYDLWRPLLLDHGRTLAEFRTFAPSAIRDDFAARLAERAADYERVVLVGHSFGGALVSDLLTSGGLDPKVRTILMAPAIHIPADTPTNRIALGAFRLWSPYCDIVALGCGVPNPRASDGPVRAAIFAQNIFFYLVPDAVLRLFDYGASLTARVAAYPGRVDIVMARDDGDVSFPATEAMCASMANCRLHALPSGSHLPQFGPSLDPLAAILIALAADPAAVCGEGCDTL